MDIKFLFVNNFASNNHFPQMQQSVDETIGDFVSSGRERMQKGFLSASDKKKTYFVVSFLLLLPRNNKGRYG